MHGDPSTIEVLDALATPVLQVAGDGRIRHANEAAGRWLRVGRKRLIGLPLAALERDGQAVTAALAQTDGSPHLLRRVQLAFPGANESLFADLWLSPVADGTWCEAHPVDEFAGSDPSEVLPLALSASLKGLAHELRNPLAGIKGAAQLLARRSDADAALRLLDASGKAYAMFPITSGTAKFPLPIGDWTIESMTPDPWYNYDPALIVTARKGDRKAKLPPGPNGPVGTMWMALSKPHYGIHGTPEPHLIGRTQSSGCVRLTNWSATAVAAASTVGMTVSMVE